MGNDEKVKELLGLYFSKYKDEVSALDNAKKMAKECHEDGSDFGEVGDLVDLLLEAVNQGADRLDILQEILGLVVDVELVKEALDKEGIAYTCLKPH